MPTLAEMLGGVDFPIRQMDRVMAKLSEGDAPSMQRAIDDDQSLMAQMVDLEKSILFQNAIGK